MILSGPQEKMAYKMGIVKGDLLIVEKRFKAVFLNTPLNKDGATAMHLAARFGHLNVIKWLASHGEHLDSKDNQGNSPLYLALLNEHIDVAKFFLERNCNVITPNHKGNQALMIICQKRGQLLYLMDLTKGCIQKQALALMEKGAFFEGIKLHNNGSIEFLNTQQDLNQSLQDERNILNLTTLVQYQSGKLDAIPIIHKQRLVTDHTQLNQQFNVPPLVFLMDHDDPIPFNTIAQLLPWLLALGYKALCFEYDETKNLAQTIDALNLMAQEPLNETISKQAQITLDFLHQVSEYPDLEYHNIDLNLDEIRGTNVSRSLLDLINEPREQNMLRHITHQAKALDGGVIVILGEGHHGIMNKLVTTFSNQASQFQFFATSQDEAEIPKEDDVVSQLKRLSLSQHGPQLHALKGSKKELVKLVKSAIMAHLMTHPTVYEKAVQPAYLGLMRAQNPEFNTCLREGGECIVDAKLLLEKPKSYIPLAQKIRSETKLNTELRFTRMADETTLTPTLVVPDLNGGPNQKNIEALNREKRKKLFGGA